MKDIILCKLNKNKKIDSSYIFYNEDMIYYYLLRISFICDDNNKLEETIKIFFKYIYKNSNVEYLKVKIVEN